MRRNATLKRRILIIMPTIDRRCWPCLRRRKKNSRSLIWTNERVVSGIRCPWDAHGTRIRFAMRSILFVSRARHVIITRRRGISIFAPVTLYPGLLRVCMPWWLHNFIWIILRARNAAQRLPADSNIILRVCLSTHQSCACSCNSNSFDPHYNFH